MSDPKTKLEHLEAAQRDLLQRYKKRGEQLLALGSQHAAELERMQASIHAHVLTMRDQLALAAMPAVTSNHGHWSEDSIAARAYRIADAMLAHREADHG